MLRGAFGHALRRTVCVMGPEQPCASCRLRHACVYTRIFEPYVEGEPSPFLRGIDQAVRPSVFEPPGGINQGEVRLALGDVLRFDLLLFGQAVELQAYAFLAVERMARAGLGAGCARFRLVRVEALGGDGALREMFSEGAPPEVPREADLPSGRLALRLETPLRVKVHDHLNGQPRFRDLAFNMLRRVLELAHFHMAGAAMDWSFRPFLDRADAVRVVAADLRWHDWERWSNRQQSSMKLGGLVGRLVLEGDVRPFAALLGAAQIVHVGKGATFGLGKLVVEIT
jgi:CRISPR-associated endoribonuclease Cas6